LNPVPHLGCFQVPQIKFTHLLSILFSLSVRPPPYLGFIDYLLLGLCGGERCGGERIVTVAVVIEVEAEEPIEFLAWELGKIPYKMWGIRFKGPNFIFLVFFKFYPKNGSSLP
jgi:hypothetical protein